jgi:hypothetical protein
MGESISIRGPSLELSQLLFVNDVFDLGGGKSLGILGGAGQTKFKICFQASAKTSEVGEEAWHARRLDSNWTGKENAASVHEKLSENMIGKSVNNIFRFRA